MKFATEWSTSKLRDHSKKLVEHWLSVKVRVAEEIKNLPVAEKADKRHGGSRSRLEHELTRATEQFVIAKILYTEAKDASAADDAEIKTWTFDLDDLKDLWPWFEEK